MKTAMKFVKYVNDDNDHDISKVILATDRADLGLSEVLNMFEDFLRACGYMVEPYSLQIAEKDSLRRDVKESE